MLEVDFHTQVSREGARLIHAGALDGMGALANAMGSTEDVQGGNIYGYVSRKSR